MKKLLTLMLLSVFFIANSMAENNQKKSGDELYQEYLYKCSVKKNGDACFTLGNYFFMNKNISQKERKSGIMYLDMGCRFQNADSCRAAGMSTYFGEYEQSKDNQKGLDYLHKGCMLKDAYSCEMYAEGGHSDLIIDDNTYETYLRLACSFKSHLGCKNLKKFTELNKLIESEIKDFKFIGKNGADEYYIPTNSTQKYNNRTLRILINFGKPAEVNGQDIWSMIFLVDFDCKSRAKLTGQAYYFREFAKQKYTVYIGDEDWFNVKDKLITSISEKYACN